MKTGADGWSPYSDLKDLGFLSPGFLVSPGFQYFSSWNCEIFRLLCLLAATSTLLLSLFPHAIIWEIIRRVKQCVYQGLFNTLKLPPSCLALRVLFASETLKHIQTNSVCFLFKIFYLQGQSPLLMQSA